MESINAQIVKEIETLSEQKSNRDLNLDIMRFVGILIILIAHSHPPAWLFQLRNFGTPLLIVASALTYAQIYSNKKIVLKGFYIRRITRLIIPAWIFLALLFVSIYIYDYSLSYKIDLHYIIQSFLLSGGKVGYLFIFKVYVFLALITPLAFKIKSYLPGLMKYYTCLFAAYCGYELFAYLAPYLFHQQIVSLFNTNIFALIAYSIIYLYGFRLHEISQKKVLMAALASFAIFAVLCYYKYSQTGNFIQTQTDKNPPHLYYMSYAFFCLNMVYLACTRFLVKVAPKKIITWLSSNSLWVYLWHIMGIEIYYSFNITLSGKLTGSILMLAFILGFAVCITIIQKWLVETFLLSREHKALNIVGTYLK